MFLTERRARTFIVLDFVLELVLMPTVSKAMEADIDVAPFTVGRVSCGDYLLDVATDPSVHSLYDAWLTGYVKIATEELSGASWLIEDVEISGVRAWVGAYCRLRASDTLLSAAVRLIEAKQQNRSGAHKYNPSGPRLAGPN